MSLLTQMDPNVVEQFVDARLILNFSRLITRGCEQTLDYDFATELDSDELTGYWRKIHEIESQIKEKILEIENRQTSKPKRVSEIDPANPITHSNDPDQEPDF